MASHRAYPASAPGDSGFRGGSPRSSALTFHRRSILIYHRLPRCAIALGTHYHSSRRNLGLQSSLAFGCRYETSSLTSAVRSIISELRRMFLFPAVRLSLLYCDWFPCLLGWRPSPAFIGLNWSGSQQSTLIPHAAQCFNPLPQWRLRHF
jgi:hypothetical protein